jgi:predicted Zn-ribbon and HTH transcriptional regulator
MKYKKEAIKKGYICPHCKSEEIESSTGITVDDNEAFMPLYCLDCNEEWIEYYTLTDIK